MPDINLAILFWFYKKPRICWNRLLILKKFCPGLKIFGLFGGKQTEKDVYRNFLGQYLDNFYTSPYANPRWKWLNGDLMILDWYNQRGKGLSWDSIAVVQWDTLVFDSLYQQFLGIKKGEIFLSGLRVLNNKLEKKWVWTQPEDPKRQTYQEFLNYIRKNYHYFSSPLCCQFIFAIFPRLFFEKYSRVKNKEIGMLEYKIPTYAKIFGIPFYKKDLGVYWHKGKQQDKPLNALPVKITKETINFNLKRRKGWRIFHPYYQNWPLLQNKKRSKHLLGNNQAQKKSPLRENAKGI